MAADLYARLGRRDALAWGANLAGGMLFTGALASCNDTPTGTSIPAENTALGEGSDLASARKAGSLPVARIQEIMSTEGTVTSGILALEQERKDLHVTGPHGLIFTPSWEMKHQFYFQPLGQGRALVNGDFCVRSREINPVIRALLDHDLIFMAHHQHFFDLAPQVWFIHFRGVGDPLDLARRLDDVVRSATSTPLPQHPPEHPTTPLDAGALARILGGTAEIGGEGVVTVSIPRREEIVVGGIVVEPDAGVEHTVAFQPLGGGQRAACAPDLALRADEVVPVMRTMLGAGFEEHCLYNQETGEHPQLYFSHLLAVGDALDLARKTRRGLEHTNTAFS
jgi:hypothetical protein